MVAMSELHDGISPSLRGRPFIEASPSASTGSAAALAVPSGTALHRGLPGAAWRPISYRGSPSLRGRPFIEAL